MYLCLNKWTQTAITFLVSCPLFVDFHLLSKDRDGTVTIFVCLPTLRWIEKPKINSFRTHEIKVLSES